MTVNQKARNPVQKLLTRITKEKKTSPKVMSARNQKEQTSSSTRVEMKASMTVVAAEGELSLKFCYQIIQVSYF